jgi:hypothetical protein
MKDQIYHMIVDRYGFVVAISDIFTKQVGSTLS